MLHRLPCCHGPRLWLTRRRWPHGSLGHGGSGLTKGGGACPKGSGKRVILGSLEQADHQACWAPSPQNKQGSLSPPLENTSCPSPLLSQGESGTAVGRALQPHWSWPSWGEGTQLFSPVGAE